MGRQLPAAQQSTSVRPVDCSSSRLPPELEGVSPEVLSHWCQELEALTSTLARATRLRTGVSLVTLATHPRWVAWREEDGAGNPAVAGVCENPKEPPKKVPRDPRTLRRARSNDEQTWGSRGSAEKAAKRLLRPAGSKGGVGIQLGEIDGLPTRYLCGIDLDSCLGAGTQKLTPEALEVLARFPSYTEVSPSGSGLKILFQLDEQDFHSARALVMAAGGKGKGQRKSWSRGKHDEIAFDLPPRYYTITNDHFEGSPNAIQPVTLDAVTWLFETAGPAFQANGVTDLPSKMPAPATSATHSAPTLIDQSGSGHGFRFLLEQARLGSARDDAEEALRADPGPAGEWASRVDDRQISRAWTKAVASIEAERADLDSVFADDPDQAAWNNVADHVVARLNQRHAHVMINGKARIITFQPDGGLAVSLVPDVHSYYSNDRVMLGKNFVPVSVYWMVNRGRRSYPNGLSFSFNGTPAGTYNQWRGWAVAPNPKASCELFLQHVREVICGGNESHYRYLLGWLAHLVQRPWEKPGVAVIVRGAKGAGKDSFAEYLTRLIGRHHVPTIANATHLVGRFNARMEFALLLHVQEGFWAGDKKAEGVLKYLVTSETVEIERKGIDSYSAPSVLRIFVSANAEWVVPASTDERRWAFFEAAPHRCGDLNYFRKLYAEMNADGPAALLAYLMSYDISEFDVRRAPDTEGLVDQKLATLKNVEAWWFEQLSLGSLNCGYDDVDEVDWAVAPIVVSRASLYEKYVDWLKSRRFHGDPVDVRFFGKLLRDMVGYLNGPRTTAADNKRLRTYEFPPLHKCRGAFSKFIGSDQNWPE